MMARTSASIAAWLRKALGITSLEHEVRSAGAALAELRGMVAEACGRLDRAGGRQPPSIDGMPATTATTERMTYAKLMGSPPAPDEPTAPVRRTSALCVQADFALDAYRYWTRAIGEPPKLHRKQWEFFYICQSLHERGMLEPGRRGLGFGVGTEPLPALFARMECEILATDQDRSEAARAGWLECDEHAAGAADLNRRGLCPPELFADRVTFRVVDMNHIPHDLDGAFDFCWSSCCLEHLGSLRHGIAFVKNSMKTLRPGGVAVHTTEFNLSSNAETLESRDLSLYRRQDIERLISELDALNCRNEPVRWITGDGLVDGYVDLPPFRNEPHLRLRLDRYDCTSIGLIVQRLDTA